MGFKKLVFRSALAVISLGGSLVACGGSSGSPVAPIVGGAGASSQIGIPGNKIKHVVFIVQENRSFDDMFSNYKAINPNVDTVSSGIDSTGATVPLRVQPLASATTAPGGSTTKECWDPDHFVHSFYSQSDGGKQDAFDKVTWTPAAVCPGVPGLPPVNPATGVIDWAYAAVQTADAQPYYNMAQQYALADHMYQSNNNASFVAHLFLVAGQGLNQADVPLTGIPWGCDSPPGEFSNVFVGPPVPGNQTTGTGPFPCFNALTLADLMDQANISWKYYTAVVSTPRPQDLGELWSIFDAFSKVRFGPEWVGGSNPKVVNPSTQIIADIKAGNLAAMNWVCPPAFVSDQVRLSAGKSTAYVSSIVDAVGTSQYWNDTAVFIIWDDWGGWYDHEPPIMIDNQGPGFRVPLLAISPYAKKNYISKTHYEFGSVLKFAEQALNIPSLGQTDARATSVADMFDFTQTPATFTPFSDERTRRQIMNLDRQAQGGPVPDPE